MRSQINRFASLLCAGALALLFTTPLVFAQTSDLYLISAKAGGVNLVSGKVLLKKQGDSEWRVLQPSSEREQPMQKDKKPAGQMDRRESLNSGDVVKTESTGRFEVLLNPGSYLRLAEDSEFELIDSSLDNLRLKINRGRAILEATGYGDVKLMTEVITPQTRITIIRTGLYRINVLPTATELLVRKGRAVIGLDNLTTIKDGKKAVIEAANLVAVTKFDKKKQQDAFDFWSRNRAEMLLAVNDRLAGRDLSLAILNAGFRPLRTNVGVWVYDPFYGTHTFLPFYTGWHSPYGSSYNTGFGYSSDWYRPRSVNTQPGGGGGNISTPVQPNPEDNPQRGRSMRARKDLEGDHLPVRPVGNDNGGGNGDRIGGSTQSSGGGHHSSGQSYPSSPAPAPAPAPSYTPPPSPPPSAPSHSSAPASPRADSDGGPRGKTIDPHR